MNREYKSDLFSMLMERSDYALDVYNALNQTKYDNPSDVEIIKMEKGISLTIRNDASFIVDSSINLYEHQSTVNPNMPFRNLIYVTNILQGLVKRSEDVIYGRKKIKIPAPHFVVFYNGTEEQPEEQILKLSSSYARQEQEPELELKCRVININKGKSKEVLQNSKVLSGYSYFVDKVREYEINMVLEEAVKCALRDCIKNDILAEFFKENWQEVIKVTQIDATFERQIEYEKKCSKAEGKAEYILMLLNMKGMVSEELKERILSIYNLEKLDELFKIAVSSNSIEEFETKM